MESTRDVRRLIDKEIRRGSAPLTFERLEYTDDAVREIDSAERLESVLAYLLRTGEYGGLANDMTRNNVYMEHHAIRGDSFRRRNSGAERHANYLNITAYANRCVPEYDGKTFVETVRCCFSFPQAELERYRFTYNGQETYAFPLSGRHIINGLYLMSIMHRKALASGEAPEHIVGRGLEGIYRLEGIRRVPFQCLILDDMHFEGGLCKAQLHTIYLTR